MSNCVHVIGREETPGGQQQAPHHQFSQVALQLCVQQWPLATMRDALQSLNKEDEIVVYCSGESCIASTALGQLLERNGYPNVLHFAGSLQEWEQAGYPLEGEWVKKQEE